MLEGVCMILGNRHTYTSFVDNCVIYSDWGAQKFFSFHRGVMQKIIEKHCPKETHHTNKNTLSIQNFGVYSFYKNNFVRTRA